MLERLGAYFAPICALVVLLGCAGYGYWNWRNLAGLFEQNLAYHEALRHELSGMQRDRLTLEALLPNYRSLNAAGAFNSEDRLAWINAVDSTVQDLGLAHVRYLVYPQTPYDGASLPSEGFWAVRASRMRLELGLAHAGELLDFVAAVQARVLGTLHVVGCELDRRVVGREFSPHEINLNVVCEVDWLTLDNQTERT